MRLAASSTGAALDEDKFGDGKFGDIVGSLVVLAFDINCVGVMELGLGPVIVRLTQRFVLGFPKSSASIHRSDRHSGKTFRLREDRQNTLNVPVVPLCPNFLPIPADPIMRTVRKPTLSEKEIMRIERKTLTLIIASLCGASSSAIALGQDPTLTSPASSVGRIGDSGLAGRAPQAAVPLDSRPADLQDGVATDAGLAPTGTFYDPTMHEASYSQPSFTQTNYSVGSMDSGSYVTSSRNTGTRGTPSSSGWLETETILWWGKGIQGIPLAVGGTSPQATPANVLAGGIDQPTGTDLQVGMRLNTGIWLDDCQNFGVGGRVWGIFSDGNTTTYTNGGNSTAVPFFNTAFGAPALLNVNEAGAVPADGANTGTIQVRSDLDLIASELYARSLLAKSGNSRVDLLTGYTFLRLDNELGLRTQIIDGLNTNIIQNGTVSTLQDNFSTKNQFHGGHIGLSQELKKGRFTFSALGKVAIGNMQQTTNVNGNFAITNTPNPANGNRGLFAQSSNSEPMKRNQFTFLPEAGAKIKYQLGRAEFGVGYTMLMLPSVAMAASQMDQNIDFNGAINNLPILSPAPKFTSEAFFLHGIDLGLTFQF